MSVSTAFSIFLLTISAILVFGFVFLSIFIVWRTNKTDRYDVETYNVKIRDPKAGCVRFLNPVSLEFEDDGTITVVVEE